MINYNGQILDSQHNLSLFNRGFLYGDAVFETLKIVDNKILFFEDHYFRLMSSMRIVRMTIPFNFTMEFLEEQIIELVKANCHSNSARVRFTVFRNDGGLYSPETNATSFVVTSNPLENMKYQFSDENYEVDLYKDYFIAKQLLSTLKTNNRVLNVTASVFAKENEFNNCILLNNEKNVVEAINGNIFLLYGTKLVTPPTSDGCLNGILRKQIINLTRSNQNFEFVEESVSTFDLQKADEIFITNVIAGIQPITKYRKRTYSTIFSKIIVEKLNQLI